MDVKPEIIKAIRQGEAFPLPSGTMVNAYIIKGYWAPYVGTDYCDVIGFHPSEASAHNEATDYAWDRWEGGDDDESEEGFEDEGPDFYTEIYVQEEHDRYCAGGGSFLPEFVREYQNLLR